MCRLGCPSVYGPTPVLKACSLVSPHLVNGDSARGALIKGYSPVVSSAELVEGAWMEEVKRGSSGWYDRVPGPSNLGDDPSRLEATALLRAGAQPCAPVWPAEWLARWPGASWCNLIEGWCAAPLTPAPSSHVQEAGVTFQ